MVSSVERFHCTMLGVWKKNTSTYDSTVFLLRRNKVGVLASRRWPEMPKFNNPLKKAELEDFSAEIAGECGMDDIGFSREGIKQHVRQFFNEQRRSKKNATNVVSIAII